MIATSGPTVLKVQSSSFDSKALTQAEMSGP